MSRVHDINLRWISWQTVMMRHHKSQYSVLIVTIKNHTKEGLTNHKFAEELHDPPPPKKKKLLNRICIDLKNDPNGSEKNEFPLKNGKTPCLIATVPICLYNLIYNLYFVHNTISTPYFHRQKNSTKKNIQQKLFT